MQGSWLFYTDPNFAIQEQNFMVLCKIYQIYLKTT